MPFLKKFIADITNYINDEIYTPLRTCAKGCLKILTGTRGMSPAYSIHGIINGYQFFITILAFFCIQSFVNLFKLPLLSYITGLILLSFMLFAVQKRCRDFNYDGTVFIMTVSLAVILTYATTYINYTDMNRFWKWTQLTEVVLYCITLFLILIPSKPDADINLTSPLMKHPVIYTAVCFVLCIAATWTVNHYYGINIELF